MKIKKLTIILFLIVLTLFTSCRRSEDKVEKNNIEMFRKNSKKLNSSVNYIISKYYTDRENVKVILSDNNYKMNNIYYDSYLKKILKNTNIRLVTINNNNPCQDNALPYEIFFEINSTSSRQYYYVYKFCEHNYQTIDESQNYKVIPLNKIWRMDIEKN